MSSFLFRLLLIGVIGNLLSVDLAAQVPPPPVTNPFYDCIAQSPEANTLRANLSVDEVGNYYGPQELLKRVFTCSLEEAQNTVVPVMQTVFNSFCLFRLSGSVSR